MTWLSDVKNRRYTSFGLAVLWTAIAVAFAQHWRVQARHNMEEIALAQAVVLDTQMDEIIRWNIMYGGIFLDSGVKVPEGLRVNPGGVLSTDGRRFTNVLFPEMIRLMSSVPDRDRKTVTRLVSLKPLNPKNAPDVWERAALLRAENGEPRVYGFSRADNGRQIFRYLRALYVKTGCLDCHAIQGYHVGDVRGGESIIIDVNNLARSVNVDSIKDTTVVAFVWIVGLGGIFVVFAFAERRETYLAEMEVLSLTDQLTGLSNRRGFLILAQQTIKLMERDRSKAVLMYLDLDGFKLINDDYGHDEGDAALVMFSQVLRSTFRSSDLLARMGGDEFVVLALKTERSFERTITDRLRRNLEKANSDSGKPYSVRISIGVVEYDPDRPAFFEELIVEADRLMYENKAAGKAAGSGGQDD